MLSELRVMNGLERHADQRQRFLQVAAATVSVAMATLGLLLAVNLAVRHLISIGDIALYVAAASGVQGGLAILAGAASHLVRAHGVYARYVELMDTAKAQVSQSVSTSVPRLTRAIVFDDVWFRYSPNLPWILEGLSLVVPAGMFTGIIGLNGAGKSTIIKLLNRLYEPTEGRILWDGIDIRTFDVRDYRTHLATMFQDYVCYDLTLRENIGLGDVSSIDDDDAIGAALEGAGLKGAAESLPLKWETMLSRIFSSGDGGQSSGVRLSGGEWQKVAAARTMMRSNVDVMLLDEPTSGLDATAEAELVGKVVAMRAGRTTAMISHRLFPVVHAERIAVIDHGRLVEEGRHAELMSRPDGLYSTLYRAQMGTSSGAGAPEVDTVRAGGR
jgi:ATP-binding cassette subfamily B protein